jgi:succinoglycan biosynthesis transport protein ExoP
LQQNQNIIVEKLHQLSSAATTAQDQKLKTEADLELFQKTDPSRTEELLKIPSVASLPMIASFNQQINQAQTELASYKERYLPKHPKYIAATNKIHSLESALSKAVANAGNDIVTQHEIACKNYEKLEASLKEQESKSLELDKLSVEYNVLVREVESDRTLYSSVISRMKETGVTMDTENTPFVVLEEPLPGSPVRNNIPLILGGAFLLLSFLTTSVIIAIDLTASSIRSLDQAELHFGLPVLASIPVMHQKKGTYFLAQSDAPGSPAAEAFRTLRTSIAMRDEDKNIKGFTLITSAVPEEGKTITSVNTALCFAQLGEKTLLIDTDMRRPSLHHILLNGKEGPGLSDLLEKSVSLEDSIHPTRFPNLSIMPAGKRTSKPSELLTNSDIRSIFKRLRDQYNHIILDSAPVNAVSDSLIIAHHADRVCLVIRAEKTPRKVIDRALQLIHQTGAKICGTILNRLQHRGAGYYYYYYAGKYGKDSVYGQDTPA